MSDNLAFVGDIHGNADALIGLWNLLGRVGHPHTVFLGDYVNRGPKVRDTLEFLFELQKMGAATLLAGNHEKALVDAVETGEMRAFLKMGGATTVRSFVGGPVGHDALADFRSALPHAYLQLLRSMPDTYETRQLRAQHMPTKRWHSKYLISAHVYAGLTPSIKWRSAQIDTGCGPDEAGRLTALLWPSKEVIQVNFQGLPVRTAS